MSVSLAELETLFQRHILDGDPRVLRHVRASAALSAARRLEVYHDAYRLRLCEAVSSDFPALHTLLGDEDFTALLLAYIAARPSHYRSIRWFAGELADFLSTQAPWCEQPVLAEMARFEWALAHAHDAADAPSIGREALAELDAEGWATLHPRLHPSVTLLSCHWDTPPLWQAIHEQEAARAPQAVDTQGWVVWRDRERRARYLSLTPPLALWLAACAHGEDFAASCEQLSEQLGKPDADTLAALALEALCCALDHGLISAI